MSLACLRAAAGHPGVDVGPEHGVGLPELVGEFHAEGEAFLGVGVARGEQFVLANEAVEGGLGDAAWLQEGVLDAEAIEGALVGALVVEVGLGRIEGFEEFLGTDLAGVSLVLAWLVGHAGDAVVFVAVEPGLDGAPGELAWVALLVEEGHGGDVVDAFVAGSAGGGVDGAEDAHLQIDRRQLHESNSVNRWHGPGEGRLKQSGGDRHQDSLRCWPFSRRSVGQAATALGIRSRWAGHRGRWGAMPGVARPNRRGTARFFGERARPPRCRWSVGGLHEEGPQGQLEGGDGTVGVGEGGFQMCEDFGRRRACRSAGGWARRTSCGQGRADAGFGPRSNRFQRRCQVLSPRRQSAARIAAARVPTEAARRRKCHSQAVVKLRRRILSGEPDAESPAATGPCVAVAAKDAPARARFFAGGCSRQIPAKSHAESESPGSCSGDRKSI